MFISYPRSTISLLASYYGLLMLLVHRGDCKKTKTKREVLGSAISQVAIRLQLCWHVTDRRTDGQRPTLILMCSTADTAWRSSWPQFVLGAMWPVRLPRRRSPSSWWRERPSVSSVSRRLWSASWEHAVAVTASPTSRPAGRPSPYLGVVVAGWWSRVVRTATATCRVRPATSSSS